MSESTNRGGEVVRSWIVRGRVQRVGFRWWTRNVALDLGVRGWVRNLADGSVEVHGAGDAGSIDSLDQALREGPAQARVDSVADGDGDHARIPAEGFEIVR